MLSSHSLLISEFPPLFEHFFFYFISLIFPRRNPSVLSKAEKVFTSIVQALEAETLQGNVCTKVVEAAKQLVAATGINADQILNIVRPENQMAVRRHFQ